MTKDRSSCWELPTLVHLFVVVQCAIECAALISLHSFVTTGGTSLPVALLLVFLTLPYLFDFYMFSLVVLSFSRHSTPAQSSSA